MQFFSEIMDIDYICGTVPSQPFIWILFCIFKIITADICKIMLMVLTITALWIFICKSMLSELTATNCYILIVINVTVI